MTDHRARPTLHRASALVVLAILAVLAAACSSDDDVETGSGDGSGSTSSSAADEAPDDGVRGRDWVLAASGTSFPVPDGVDITLRIDGDEATGSSGCNSYTTTVEIDGDTIRFAAAASTMMACAEPERTEAEAAYLAALAEVETFEVDGEGLVLRGGATTLAYTELPPVPDPSAEVLVGAWTIDSIATGSGPSAAVSSAVAGTEPTLTFDADGTYSVAPACNTGSGEWTLDGSALTLTEPATTMMACVEPEGAAAQETSILLALPSVASVEVQRGGVDPEDAATMLSLLDAEGNLLLGLSRQS